MARDPVGVGAVEDRLPGEARRGVALRRQHVRLLTAVLSAPLVMAVRVGRRHDRAEPAVVERVGVRHVGDEAEVLLQVVARRERVAAGAVVGAGDEAVEATAVVLMAPAVPAVVGVLELAALEVGGQPVRRHHVAAGVGVAEAGVLGVGLRVPAEVVVKTAVLHHEHDEGVDRQVLRLRQVVAADPVLGGLGDQLLGRQHRGEAGRAREERRLGEELAPPKGALRVLGRLALELTLVGELSPPREVRMV